MANFSENNVRHLYVLGDVNLSTSGNTFIDRDVNPTLIGDLGIKAGANGEFYFNYVSPNGDLGGSTIVRSLIVDPKKVNYSTAKMPAFRNTQTVEVDIPTSIAGGVPIVGQDYILRFIFYNLGIGGQECQYLKESGAYRVRLGNTKENVFDALVDLAKKNFAREPYPLVTIVKTGTGSTAKLVITGVEQPWVLGHKQGDPIPFKVECVPVYDSGSNVHIAWGEVTDVTPATASATSIFNGKTIADMEWCYLGERADHRRGYDYPDNFITKRVADPTKKYDTVDLDGYFAGDKEDVQKSRFCLSFACIDKVAVPSALDSVAEQLKDDLETLGLKVITD
jgi:hypothetical protein